MTEVKTTRGIAAIFNDLISYTSSHEDKAIKTEDEEIAEQINANFRRCGATETQCNKAGFEKFINYRDNPRQKLMFKTCFDYVTDIINGDNKVLVLHGNPGTGKTYFSLSIMKQFCSTEKPMKQFKKWVRNLTSCDSKNCSNCGACDKDKGCECGSYALEDSGIREFKSGEYIKSDELCEKVLGKQKNLTPQIARKIYSSCELLIIDEIGRPTGFNAKAESEVLFKILDERKENNLPTVLCSNLNYTELQELMGRALFSRLAENGIFFDTSEIDDMRSKIVRNYMEQIREMNR